MSLISRIRLDMKAAMKGRDALGTATLRLLISAIQKQEKDSGEAPDDDQVVVQVKRAIKARREAADMYRKGGRADLADKEDSERALLEAYLPALLGEEETGLLIADAIKETGVTDPTGMGKVMGHIMSKHRAHVDGALVRRLVVEALAAGT